MTYKPEQFTGGALLAGESSEVVCADHPTPSRSNRKLAVAGAPERGLARTPVQRRRGSGDFGVSDTDNCVTLPAHQQQGTVNEIVGIRLDVRSWVENVLIPVLVDEFLEKDRRTPE